MRQREFLGGSCALPDMAMRAPAAAAMQMKITEMQTDRQRFPPGRHYYDAIGGFGAGSGAVVPRQ